MKTFAEYIEGKNINLDEKKWIQKAIKHPGRCADMGGPECPEGSPQYNLAKRFKSKEFKKKKKS